jgi:hypothetical protein
MHHITPICYLCVLCFFLIHQITLTVYQMNKKTVARPSPTTPPKYTLLSSTFSDLQINTWKHYNSKERQDADAIYTKFVEGKVASTSSSSSISRKRKASGDDIGESVDSKSNKARKVTSGPSSSISTSLGLPPTAPPAKSTKVTSLITDEIDKYLKDLRSCKPQVHPPIKDKRMYDNCSTLFRQRFKMYEAIGKALLRNKEEFLALGSDFDSAPVGSEANEAIKDKIIALGAAREKEVNLLESTYKELHEELSSLKSNIAVFVNEYSS